MTTQFTVRYGAITSEFGSGGANVVPTQGIASMRSSFQTLMGSIAAPYVTLAALTASKAKDRVDGQLVVTLDTYTLWTWKAADTTAADADHVAPTDVGVGAGRWVSSAVAEIEFSGGAPVNSTAAAAAAGTSAYPARADHRHQVLPSQIALSGIFSARGVVTANVASLASFAVAGNDGITYVAGDVVLLVGQTTGSQNGPYVVGTVGGGNAPLTRPTWWATGAAVPIGAVINVGAEGTAQKNSHWKATNDHSKVIDTDDPQFYPRTIKGTQALSGGAATVSNLFIMTGAVVMTTDTTATAASKGTVTAGQGTGSIALAGTTTDTIAYVVTNY